MAHAIRFSKTGGPEVLQWEEVSVPAPGAGELQIRHKAVGLVDRLVTEGLAIRRSAATDRRKVELRLSAHGRQVLAKLAAIHRAELGRIGPTLERLIAEARSGAD